MLNSGHRLPKLMFPKGSVSFDYSQVRDRLEQADQYLKKMQRGFFYEWGTSKDSFVLGVESLKTLF